MKCFLFAICLLPTLLRAQTFDTTAFFKEIDKYCLYPTIVKAQACLETNYFTSKQFKVNNNCFGYTNFKTGKYQKYDNIHKSVQSIKHWQKRRKNECKISFQDSESYFALLDKRYCFEVPYSQRLKAVMKSKKFKRLINK